MHLYDTLQICLLALDRRYPIHTLDLSDDFIEVRSRERKDWMAQELLTFLETNAPDTLQVSAHLVIDGTRCVIYVSTYSQEQPAISIHCRGKIPHHRVQVQVASLK